MPDPKPFWTKLTLLSFTLFFIFLGDAILSFWVPNLLESSFKSPFAMGLILSFSSLVGLVADLVLPQLVKHFSVKKLFNLGIAASILFSLSLLLALKYPLLIIFLFAMAVWGLYYEFFGFGSRQFVADSAPLRLRSSSWAFIGAFKNLAYFLGPLVSGFILFRGSHSLILLALFFTGLGFFLLLFSRSPVKHPQPLELKQVNPVLELSRWFILVKSVWPMVIISLFLGLIDSFFWSIGAVWTEKLGCESLIGKFFLPAHTLPALFVGFLVVKWGIYRGKKIMAEKFLFLSGILLAALMFSANVYWQVLVVFFSSLALSVVYPLVEAVYSDVVARMGREKKHLIGLSNSIISLAYIIGPALAGFIANYLGERLAISAIGLFTAAVAWVLIFVTPAKLKLPQSEIKDWQ